MRPNFLNILYFNAHKGCVSIRNISDYSPFGVLLPERTTESAFYRNGFQGQERDDEVNGAGNSVNFKFRMHDPRVGRFFAVDPLSSKYPYNSSYAFSENRVIDGVELEGLEFKTTGPVFDPYKLVYKETFTIKISVTNSSKIIKDQATIDTYKSAIKKTIENDFKGGKGTFFDPIVTTKVQFVAPGNGFTMRLGDAIPDGNGNYTTGRTENGIGETQFNSLFVSITLGGKARPVSESSRTASHELGHAGGLRHPFHGAPQTDIGGKVGPWTYKDNLMNSDGGSRDPKSSDFNPIPSTKGHKVSSQQLRTISFEILKDVNSLPKKKI